MGATASTSAISNSVSVYHKDRNGVLHPCDSKTTEAVLAAAVQELGLAFQPQVNDSPSDHDRTPKFDLKRFKQLKWDMFEDEDIVIEIPWNARISKAAVSLNRDSSLRVRPKALEMALNRIRQLQSLSKILDIKAVPECSMRENPNLGPGHLPYDNFLTSLVAATLTSKRSRHESPSSGEKLFDAILETAWYPTESNVRLLESQGLWIVFHGTDHAVMDGILSTGLLPEFRRSHSDRDWFGVSYGKSLNYTRVKTPGLSYTSENGCKLLVFMVLHPSAEVNSAVTSKSNVYQLPLAEITLL